MRISVCSTSDIMRDIELAHPNHMSRIATEDSEHLVIPNLDYIETLVAMGAVVTVNDVVYEKDCGPYMLVPATDEDDEYND